MDARLTRHYRWLFAVWVGLTTTIAAAQERSSLVGVMSTDPTPAQDDANLHAVQFIGSRTGYAVGDQGMVWRSEDGGQTWQPRPLPEALMLRTVSFLSDRRGWVGGTRWQPFTGLAAGVIYATQDGGESWFPVSDQDLPAIIHMRWFSPDEAVAVCRPETSGATGVYRTQDGGQSWQPLSSSLSGDWMAAAILHPELGLAASRDGQISLIAGNQLLASRLPALSGRAIRGVTLNADETGWLVGDGGLVLTTHTGGVVWQSPPGELPEGLRDVMDFACVESRGTHVWLTGHPGSTIWHSPDQGHTWEPQRTGQTLPILSLRFLTEEVGVAVGEMGTILRTTDSGRTWTATQGQPRRAAWLSIVPEPSRVPLECGVKLNDEEGYRGVIWVASFQPPTSTVASSDPRDRLPAAVHIAKINTASIGWQLPIDRPDLWNSPQGLMQRWQERTEQRAPQVLVESLVRQLRTYQPDVVFLPNIAEGDALGSYVLQASQVALAQAADSTRSLALQELTNLPPWQVRRVFQELPVGSRGDVTVSPEDYLPRAGDALQNVTAPGLSLLAATTKMAARSYRRLEHDSAASPHAGGFFAGIDVAPGTPTRRSLVAIDERQQAIGLKRLQSQRNFAAYAQRVEADSMQNANLIAQLPDVLRDLAVDQAVVVMSNLAEQYRQQSQYELAESTYLELIRRHPQHPAALAAMEWLMQYWTSSEVAYLRLRGTGQSLSVQASDPQAIQQRIDQAQQPGGTFLAAPLTVADVVPRPAQSPTNRVMVSRGVPTDAAPNATEQWRQRAVTLAEQLSQQSPRLFQQPEIQLPFAALMRNKKSAGQADEVYRRFQLTNSTGPLAALVEQELWLAKAVTTPPRQLSHAQSVQIRPVLDGVLSDPCWQSAQEVSFAPPSPDPELPAASSGFAMFAYDPEFLYIAAHVKRDGRSPRDLLLASDRDHDADLTDHDRIGIALDLDRDYTTWYEFSVDERGQTRDRCWEDATFNPKWYVACTSEPERWQVEIAIPWSELTDFAPNHHDVWGLSVVRTIPQEGYHAANHPASWPPTWETFGLVRFE